MLAAVIGIMMATSMSVFGFLSKAHLQQGAETLDNVPKIERLDDQISREKARIADDQKVIGQLDATVNSFIGKDNGDRALQVRRSQDRQRSQLRTDINNAQKSIDQLNTEKAPLASEVKKLQLDVGPLRYIGELIYGSDNVDKNIESAVKLFSMLIVLILDPSAVMLLTAYNHSVLRRENEKKQKAASSEPTRPNLLPDTFDSDPEASPESEGITSDIPEVPAQAEFNLPENDANQSETEIHAPIPEESVEFLDEEKEELPLSANNALGSFQSEPVDEQKDVDRNDENILLTEQGSGFNDSPPEGRTQEEIREINEKEEIIEEEDSSPPLRTTEIVYENRNFTSQEEEQVPVITEEPSPGVWFEAIDDEEEKTDLERFRLESNVPPLPIVRQPLPSRVAKDTGFESAFWERRTESSEDTISSIEPTIDPLPVAEIPTPHFVPQKARNYRAFIIEQDAQNRARQAALAQSQVVAPDPTKVDKYPKALSWLTEFERTK